MAPLHRAVCVLIGISYVSALSAVFGIAVGVAIAALADSGPSPFVRTYPEMVITMISLWSLPSGILGGLVCGVVRGERIYVACLSACILAILATLAGAPQGAGLLELVIVGGSLVLVALSSTTICCLLIRRIARKRNAVVQATREDPRVSPGKSQAFLVNVIAMMLIAGVITSLLFLGSRGSEFVLGLVAGASLVMTCSIWYMQWTMRWFSSSNHNLH